MTGHMGVSKNTLGNTHTPHCLFRFRIPSTSTVQTHLSLDMNDAQGLYLPVLAIYLLFLGYPTLPNSRSSTTSSKLINIFIRRRYRSFVIHLHLSHRTHNLITAIKAMRLDLCVDERVRTSGEFGISSWWRSRVMRVSASWSVCLPPPCTYLRFLWGSGWVWENDLGKLINLLPIIYSKRS